MILMRTLCVVPTLLAAFLIANLASAQPIQVVVWDEQQPSQQQAYSNFLGNEIASHLASQPGLAVRSVNLDDAGQGLHPRRAGHLPGRTNRHQLRWLVDRLASVC